MRRLCGRRTACALLGSSLAGVAGCGGQSTPSDEGSPTATATPTAETEPSSDRTTVTGINAPAEVAVMQSFDIALTIRNPTDGTATYASDVSVRRTDGDDGGGAWSRFGRLEREIEPGTTTVRATLQPIPYLGQYAFRLDGSGRTWEMRTTPRELRFGESFRTPRGHDLAVLGGDLTETYSPGSNTTRTPPPDTQWLLVLVEFRNRTDEAVSTPPFGTFAVRAAGETYATTLSDPTQQASVPPSSRTRVELPFVVSTTVTASDLEVWWQPEFQGGRTAAFWTQ